MVKLFGVSLFGDHNGSSDRNSNSSRETLLPQYIQQSIPDYPPPAYDELSPLLSSTTHTNKIEKDLNRNNRNLCFESKSQRASGIPQAQRQEVCINDTRNNASRTRNNINHKSNNGHKRPKRPKTFETRKEANSREDKYKAAFVKYNAVLHPTLKDFIQARRQALADIRADERDIAVIEAIEALSGISAAMVISTWRKDANGCSVMLRGSVDRERRNRADQIIASTSVLAECWRKQKREQVVKTVRRCDDMLEKLDEVLNGWKRGFN